MLPRVHTTDKRSTRTCYNRRKARSMLCRDGVGARASSLAFQPCSWRYALPNTELSLAHFEADTLTAPARAWDGLEVSLASTGSTCSPHTTQWKRYLTSCAVLPGLYVLEKRSSTRRLYGHDGFHQIDSAGQLSWHQLPSRQLAAGSASSTT